MILRLHATTKNALEGRAKMLDTELIALCELVLARYFTHREFRELTQQVKMLPNYVNTFANKNAQIHVKNTKRGVSADDASDVLTAYAIGIANRDRSMLRDITAELKLAIFVE